MRDRNTQRNEHSGLYRLTHGTEDPALIAKGVRHPIAAAAVCAGGIITTLGTIELGKTLYQLIKIYTN